MCNSYILAYTIACKSTNRRIIRYQWRDQHATADYFQRGLEKAEQQQATLVILRLDTPGGLDKSMRDIIKNITSSPMPLSPM